MLSIIAGMVAIFVARKFFDDYDVWHIDEDKYISFVFRYFLPFITGSHFALVLDRILRFKIVGALFQGVMSYVTAEAIIKTVKKEENADKYVMFVTAISYGFEFLSDLFFFVGGNTKYDLTRVILGLIWFCFGLYTYNRFKKSQNNNTPRYVPNEVKLKDDVVNKSYNADKYCRFCGSKIPADSLFCPACGKKIA